MLIKNHKLYFSEDKAVQYKASPNISKGMQHKYLVLHYTANDSFQGAINTLTNPANKVSAHIVLGRDGSLAQLVDFNTVAWHAGKSQWKNLTGINKYSIGIEMCNFGPLTLKDKKYYSWTKKEIPASDIFLDSKGKPWQIYPHKQLEVIYDLARLLVKEYGLIDVLAHSDICIPAGRKQDSGPAFAMKELRKELFNREDPL